VRKILGKETGENWIEELHDLYFSSSIIQGIKYRR
jgi:predicted DNA-binding protein